MRQAGQLLQHQAVVPILSRRVWLPLGRQRLPWHLSAAQHVVDGIFWVRAVLFRLNEHALSMSPPSWCKCMHWARIRALDICIGFVGFSFAVRSLGEAHSNVCFPTRNAQPFALRWLRSRACPRSHRHLWGTDTAPAWQRTKSVLFIICHSAQRPHWGLVARYCTSLNAVLHLLSRTQAQCRDA